MFDNASPLDITSNLCKVNFEVPWHLSAEYIDLLSRPGDFQLIYTLMYTIEHKWQQFEVL
jgi:hypothetical protein